MSYQKFYTNPIQSSSLLCQLATMWKNDVMCDAVIRAGAITTKAHRVVMMAACPMLQSMDHVASGSQLEIRLSADIKLHSIQSFLQYLYEGFMMVTEDNYRDIEKIGRLLQVDSVIKCCADFCKTLTERTRSLSSRDQYRYTFCDMIEFRHVRSSELQRTMSDSQVKRSNDTPGYDNSVKRSKARHNSGLTPTTTNSLPNQSKSHPNGSIVRDSLELIQTEPADTGGARHSIGVGVISHSDRNKETSVIIPKGDRHDSDATAAISSPPDATAAMSSPPGTTVPCSSSLNTMPRTLSSSLPCSPVRGHSLGLCSSAEPTSSTKDDGPGDLSDRTLVIAGYQTDSCEPNDCKAAEAQRLASSDRLCPDLSIVKIESRSPEEEANSHLREQEQVSADYRTSGAPIQRSRSSKDTDQQGIIRRPCDDTAQNDALRCSSGGVIHRHSEGQPSCLSDSQDQLSTADHRNYSYRLNHLGKLSKPHSVSSPPYTSTPATSSSMFLPPLSGMSHLMLPMPIHHPITSKPSHTELIDLSQDELELRKSGDNQPSALHRLMYIPNRKPCTWCQIKGVKTKSGWYCYASYKCEVCDVPLCKQGRVCFLEYHRHIGIPESEIVNPNSDSNTSFSFDFNSCK